MRTELRKSFLAFLLLVNKEIAGLADFDHQGWDGVTIAGRSRLHMDDGSVYRTDPLMRPIRMLIHLRMRRAPTVFRGMLGADARNGERIGNRLSCAKSRRASRHCGGKEMRRTSVAGGCILMSLVASILAGCSGSDGEPVTMATGTAAGPVAWTRVLGGSGEQMGWQVATTNTGEIVVAGMMQSRVDFGAVGQIDTVSDGDIFVAWLKPDGEVERVRRFGETGLHIPTGIAVDSNGGVILTGVMMGSVDFGGGKLDNQGGMDAFLVSLAPNGDYRFAIQVGNTQDQSGTQVALNSDGDILWLGTFEGSVSIAGTALQSAGQADLFISKISPAGKTLWAHALGSASVETAAAMSLLPQNQILLSGYYEGAPNLGDGALPDAAMLGGQFLAALDATGKLSWSRGMTNEMGYFSFSPYADENGLPWLIGSMGGEVDLFGTKLTTPAQGVAVVQLDSNGQPLSSQVFAGQQVGFVQAAKARGGGFVVAGEFQENLQISSQVLESAGVADVFLLWIDGQGRVTRQTRAGGSGEERFGGISMLPSGRVAVTGAFEGTMNAGDAAYTSNSGPDGFVMLFN